VTVTVARRKVLCLIAALSYWSGRPDGRCFDSENAV
jgi:hypothetical protein